MIEVVMPEMGESVAEGTITRWLVAIGDPVDKDQPIVEVSTDKVDAEIPSPAAGTLREIRAEEGAVVQVSEVLAVIATDGDRAAAAAPASRGAASRPGADARQEAGPEAEEHAGSAAAPTGSKVEGELAAPAADRESGRPGAGGGEPGVVAAPPGRALVTPIARRMAAAEGLDVASIRGSGAQGRVTKEDVLRAVEELRHAPAAARPAAAPPVSAAGATIAGATAPPRAARPGESEPRVRPVAEGERVEIEPMSRLRKLTARHMVHSRDTSVHVTTVFHIDMTRVVDTRNRVKAAFEREHGTRLTYMPFIFRALAGALRAHPKFNASIDGETIVYKKDVNLGMAVALDWGLIVPVIHDADQVSLAGLAKKANDLAERARAKRLKPDEIQRGTFTVTNPGVFGSLFGTPIIHQPQVAILCLGAIEKRPVVATDADGHDSIAIRHMAYFALTYDHRLIDGADAEIFMRDVKTTLETESWSELR
ncbi:MAG TPA: 2-oxoglutarate dehydrogenase, E2 component, dihydrolipoamide succinyltransferase [Thermoanaerobaculia bacterium]|nr:2-oxoglutarate dehydrogenase, E2 component, dihydrolipoamide succinyltransferase [Thermoanaerobaculia bacterium]